MLKLGLNQMTMRHAPVVELLDTAVRLGCTGIELRNDLGSPLFKGMSPEQVRDETICRGLRVLALAEVYGFNGKDAERIRAEVHQLCALATSLGSEAIVLIPEIAEYPLERGDQIKLLRVALDLLMPIIEKSRLVALIEPLGFLNSSLRFKADAVRVLDEMGRPACFALVHDTFHHALSGEVDVYGDLTRVVHISGVDDRNCATHAFTDAHRGLVTQSDRLGNLKQISLLRSQGFVGPYSFEAFSPKVHALENPIKALLDSAEFINSALGE